MSFSRRPTATWAMKGMRLLGMPLGSSPMRPDSWAPTGLKYRRRAMDQRPSEAPRSARMSSICSLVRPYGLLAPISIFSTKGAVL